MARAIAQFTGKMRHADCPDMGMTSSRICLLLALVPSFAFPAEASQLGKLERGRYLAEEVAKCQECHTARTSAGQPDRAVWMKGGLMAPGRVAPDITPSGAVWRERGEQGMVRYLVNGKHPNGKSAAAPMPAFRLRPDDAEAIVAYLKSLK